jgi:PPK2 family polyphosphate:nucleotide phosphotransferase
MKKASVLALPNVAKYKVSAGDVEFVESLDPDEVPDGLGKKGAKATAEAIRPEIEGYQSKLWAEAKSSLLIVLQGLDTAGKDSTIRRVFEGVNPQGVEVHSFKVPTEDELAHDFLWRIHKVAPKKGQITIFNRSYYEDVLVPRATSALDKHTIDERLQSILNFETHLSANNVHILKFFLKISFQEQDRRLLERLSRPEKNWKFSTSDLETRRKRESFQRAYIDTVAETSTKHAPWYVVPADHRWLRDLIVLEVILETMREIDPKFPKAHLTNLPAARKEIEGQS